MHYPLTNSTIIKLGKDDIKDIYHNVECLFQNNFPKDDFAAKSVPFRSIPTSVSNFNNSNKEPLLTTNQLDQHSNSAETTDKANNEKCFDFDSEDEKRAEYKSFFSKSFFIQCAIYSCMLQYLLRSLTVFFLWKQCSQSFNKIDLMLVCNKMNAIKCQRNTCDCLKGNWGESNKIKKIHFTPSILECVLAVLHLCCFWASVFLSQWSIFLFCF